MAETEPVDIAQLTEAQQEALQMYTSVTDQDIKDAVPLLQRSEWNVQIAITKFFDGERADPLEEARRQAETVPAQGRTSGVLLDDFGSNSVRRRGGNAVRGPGGVGDRGGHGPRRGGWRPPLILAILFSPVTIIYKVVTLGFELLLDLWRGPPPAEAPRPRTPPTVSREQQARQTLRQEQESAYEKSLRADREKSRLKKEAEAQKAREEQRLRDRNQWRRWRASTIVPEPDAMTNEVSRLSIRLPDGERIIRKFPGSASIEEIYAFVETHDVESTEKIPAQPEGYMHEYDFKLVQTMPRAVFDTNGGIISQIGRSANLIVEPIEEDEGSNE